MKVGLKIKEHIYLAITLVRPGLLLIYWLNLQLDVTSGIYSLIDAVSVDGVYHTVQEETVSQMFST